MEFNEAPDAPELTISAPFELIVGGHTTTVHPEGSPTNVAPALAVKHQVVEFAQAAGDGSLHLRFANGIEIRVPAEARSYEPWQLVGWNGWMIGVGPDGSRFTVRSQTGSFPDLAPNGLGEEA